jgi:hypothetical protein
MAPLSRGTCGGQAEFRAALDRRWPTVSPATVVADLLSKPRVLAAAAGVLDPDEQRRLIRRRGRPWTASDDLLPTVEAQVAERSGRGRTVAVITPAALVGATAARLTASFGDSVGVADQDGLGRPVTLLAAQTAKGLEFDPVVVEPGGIVGRRPGRCGARRQAGGEGP